MATKPAEEKAKTKKTAPVKKARAKKEPASGAAVRLASSDQGSKLSKRAQKRAAKPSCRAAKCKRRYRAKGYCAFHYAAWRHNEFGNARYKQCADTSCTKPMVKNRFGYCEDHFQNYYVKGQAVAKAAPAAAPAKKEEKKEAVA
jgi:hypothetical protein